MPMYALKPPDTFPAEFHAILERGYRDLELVKPGEQVRIRWAKDGQAMSATQAGTEQRRFDAFRVNLRKYPLHRLHEMNKEVKIRATKVDAAEGFYLDFHFAWRGDNLDLVLNALVS